MMCVCVGGGGGNRGRGSDPNKPSLSRSERNTRVEWTKVLCEWRDGECLPYCLHACVWEWDGGWGGGVVEGGGVHIIPA